MVVFRRRDVTCDPAFSRTVPRARPSGAEVALGTRAGQRDALVADRQHDLRGSSARSRPALRTPRAAARVTARGAPTSSLPDAALHPAMTARVLLEASSSGLGAMPYSEAGRRPKLRSQRTACCFLFRRAQPPRSTAGAARGPGGLFDWSRWQSPARRLLLRTFLEEWRSTAPRRAARDRRRAVRLGSRVADHRVDRARRPGPAQRGVRSLQRVFTRPRRLATARSCSRRGPSERPRPSSSHHDTCHALFARVPRRCSPCSRDAPTRSSPETSI